MRRFVFMGLLAGASWVAPLLVGAGVASDPAELDLQLAAEPARVTTTSGRTFTGTLDGLRDGQLRLRLASDGGEVVYSFSREDIDDFEIPGDAMYSLGREALERGDLASALPLFTAVGRQRARYLPLLDEEQREPVVALIEASALAGDPVATIGYARQLEPFATGRKEARVVRDATLQAYADLGMDKEVRTRAAAWCASAELPPQSALGWVLLARVHLNAGEFDRAGWVALQPIAFASYEPIPHLGEAYAIAIDACHQLGDTDEALTLFREMSQRSLAWPADPSLAETGTLYQAALETGSAPKAPQFLQPEPLRPRTDPGLTLDDVRRLVRSRQP